MCSIGGWISSKPINSALAERLTAALLYYGAERGDQSAGIYVKDSNTLVKRALHPDAFIDSNEFREALSKPVTQVLTHTRFPTCGGQGDEQAQPFRAGDTVSVHNGMYWNLKELKETWNIIKASGVDSELITSFIHSYGIELLPRFLESAQGVSAIAAIYRDKLYLTRSGNPVAYATLKLDGVKLFVFASTREILLNALKYCFLMSEKFPIYDLPAGKLYEVTPSGIRKRSGHFEHGERFLRCVERDDVDVEFLDEMDDDEIDDLVKGVWRGVN